ncbi:MAG: phosphotransferase [Eubacteriales bacterium]|nr:phosphotransferase [Eubacteriales bacterium]
MIMNYEMKEKELEVFFPETVDTQNADEVKNKAFAIAEETNPGTIIINLNDTKYVSSAGLRAILAIRKEFPATSLKGVGPEVYEILEMTGFTQMLEIEKKLREVSVEGLEEIGHGATGIVYRLGDDRVLKIFFPMIGEQGIKNEIKISKAAFVSGITTAIPYEVVKCGDSLGTVYEKLSGRTYAEMIHDKETDLTEAVRKYALFMREMNHVEVDPKLFPSMKEKYVNTVATLTMLDPKVQEILKIIIGNVPDAHTFIHGDFHPKNIMLCDGEPILIDMGEASYGHPIFDIMGLGAVRTMLNAFPGENDTVGFIGLSRTEVFNSWDVLIATYFDYLSDEERKKAEGVCLLYSCVRALTLMLMFPACEVQIPPLSELVINLYNEFGYDLSFFR